MDFISKDKAMVDYCYHTHTFRCGHATGDDKDYVIAAINAGITHLGFSDHVMIKDFEQPGIRGSYSSLEEYISSITSLKKEFQKQIDIKVGFECEYDDKLLTYYKDLLNSHKVDYLILGQHFYFNDFKENIIYFLRQRNSLEAAKKYVELVLKAMDTGLFSYIAHPDLFLSMFDELNDELLFLARNICLKAKEKDIPLEINVSGHFHWSSRYPHGYPVPEFFKIAGEIGNKIVIGYDAHTPNSFLHEKDFFESLIKTYHLNVISNYRI